MLAPFMALAYNHEEISPRELKPALYELAFPVWNATPLVALDVYEHAYFVDFGTDRAGYISAFFDNLDYGVVEGWLQAYGIKP